MLALNGEERKQLARMAAEELEKAGVDLQGLARIGKNRSGCRMGGPGAVRRACDRLAEMAEKLELYYRPDLEVRRGLDGEGPLYLRRWWLEREQTVQGGEHGLYVHQMVGDDDAGFHDHPWPSASLVLQGTLQEETPERVATLRKGTIRLRSASFRHRLTLPGPSQGCGSHAFTLFATGRREKGWELEREDGSVERMGADGAEFATGTTLAGARST